MTTIYRYGASVSSHEGAGDIGSEREDLAEVAGREARAPKSSRRRSTPTDVVRPLLAFPESTGMRLLSHGDVVRLTPPNTVIRRKLDTDTTKPAGSLDVAIQEWIIPALARRFLELRRNTSDQSLPESKSTRPSQARRRVK